MFSIVNDLLGILRGRSIYPSRAVIILLLARRRPMPVLVPAWRWLPSLGALGSMPFSSYRYPFPLRLYFRSVRLCCCYSF